MPISKQDVKKALGALEAASPDLAKGGSLNSANGAAEEGGGDGKLKAPGKSMPKTYGAGAKKGGAAKPTIVKGGEDDKDEHDEEEEEEEEEQEGDDKGDDKEPPPPPATAKSFREGMPSEIQTKVDVSQFLRSLVDHTAVTVDGLRDALLKSDMATENRIDEVVEAVEGLQKSMGNIGVVLTAICERFGVIENQAAAPAKSIAKSATAANGKPAVAERTFEGGEPAAEGQGHFFKSLVGKPGHIAKAMVSEAICELVKKGSAQDIDVINFESTGYVPPELAVKLNAALN